MDVQDLYNRCTAPAGSGNDFFCLGYVSGAANTMRYTSSILDRLKHAEALNGVPLKMLALVSICPHLPIKVGATVEVFINWAKQHPKKWSESSQTGVIKALRETWPCVP